MNKEIKLMYDFSRVQATIHKLVLEAKENGTLMSKYIDYHKPFVKRIYFDHPEYGRVMVHKIEPCTPDEALLHPHPWESYVKLIKGSYLTAIGTSNEYDLPPIAFAELKLSSGDYYSILSPKIWHSVAPLIDPVYSLMILGEKFENFKAPLKPRKKFRELTKEEIDDIIENIKNEQKSSMH